MNIKIIKFLANLGRYRHKKRDLQADRLRFERFAASFIIREKCVHKEISVNGVDAEWLTPPGIDDDRVVLYLHGGGYLMGSPRTHRSLVWRIAKQANASALVIDYRLAPEHPFPAALEDAVTSYAWLLEQNTNPTKISVTGDSAGGGLALALLLKIQEKGLPTPACAALLSPWTDLTCSSPSVEEKADEDPILNGEKLRVGARCYAGETDLKSPFLSPLFGNFDKLPPLLIQVGSDEMLLDDSRRFAEKVKGEGFQVELEVWEGMIHVWQYLASFLSEGRQAIERIGQFFIKHASN
jgi:acetyl esterase/lipase